MPITVKHDPGFDLAANEALRSGQGQRNDINRQFKQKEDQLQLERDRIAASNYQAAMGNLTRMSMQNAENASQMEILKQQGAQVKDRIAFDDELTKGRVIFEYTELQKREMEKNSQGMAEVERLVSTGEWTPEQGRQAMNQLQSKALGIKAVPKYDDSPTGKQIYDQNSVVLADGSEMVMQANGTWRPTVKAKPDQTVAMMTAYAKLHSTMMDQFTDEESGTVDYDKLDDAVARTMAGFYTFKKKLDSGEYNQAETPAPTGYEPAPAQLPYETMAEVKPITATNPKTGQKIVSYDGGQSWQPLR